MTTTRPEGISDQLWQAIRERARELAAAAPTPHPTPDEIARLRHLLRLDRPRATRLGGGDEQPAA